MSQDTSPNEEFLVHGLDPNSDLENPKVMEIWVDEILKDAEITEIDCKFLKNNKKRPSERYGIDRNSLKYLGVTDEHVDRLYRALFIYSIGFYELLTKVTSNIKKKDLSKHCEVMGSIWTVYSILLEFCCKNDYKLLISQLATDYE